MADDVIVINEVSRRFKNVTALDKLSFSVGRGGVTVLLGPNGAGKTTALRIITGALPPDAGTVEVFGVDPVAEGESVRSRCGVVPATPEFYERLTARENLRFAAQIFGLGDAAPIQAAAERFGIHPALDQPVGGFSTGMKARL